VTELFLIAHLAGRTVAIPTAQVQSVVDIGEVISVPGAEPAIRGLSALRSRVVTVIDTRVALGLRSAPDAGRRAIITLVDGHHYAILVDALDDVAPFARAPLSAGLSLTGGWHRTGVGLVELDGEPVLIIDLAALVPQPQSLAA
jgi:purine-binding chemotaxis protein CheW